VADNKDSALKDVENLTRGLRAAATEATRLARATARLEKNMDEASNVVLDKTASALTALAKQSGLLEDSIKEQIKAHKHSPRELAKVIDRLEQKGDSLVKAQEAYKKSLNEIKHKHKQAIKAANGNTAAEAKSRSATVKAASRAHSVFRNQLNDLGISAGVASKNIDALVAEAKANKAAIIRASQDLAKPSARIGKALEGMHSKVQDSIGGFGKFSIALDLAKKAVGELWGQSIRLANKGLVGSMAQMNISALKLRMTAEEFEGLVSANRDMIAVMGGGAEGIAKFESVLSASSVGLEYLGKEGKKAAAVILSGFSKAGFGMMSANKDVSDAYTSNIKALNKQFKLFNGAFGDTAEEFANLYEQQLKSEGLQARLISGDTKTIGLQMQEIMTRTQTLKLMGLNNDQIVEMTKRVDATFNPQQNRQADAQMERAAARQAIASGAQAVQGTDPDISKKLMDFVSSGEMERLQKMSTQDQSTYMVNNVELFKSMAKMRDIITAQRDADGTDASFKGNVFVDRAAAAGKELEKYMGLGKDANSAQARGFDQSKAGQDKLAAASYSNTLSGANGETTELGKAFGRLRDAVDGVTAVMGNPFTSAVSAFGAAMLATSSTVRGAVQNVAGKMLKSATSFSTGVGGLLKNVLGGVMRWVMAFGLDKVLGLAGVGDNKIDETQDDANWNQMTAWEKMQSGTGRGIEKVGSFFGLENITNSAQAGRIDKESAWLKSQGRGATPTSVPQVSAPPAAATPTQSSATNKTNEALMLKALADKGITDPRQQAMLMGQLSHESGGFSKLFEGGAASYFSKYEGRTDLGNTTSGDGYKFRGRGFIQLTGKSNYEQASKALGIDLVGNPDMASDPQIAAQIAAWYVTKDREGGSSADLAANGDFNGLTKSINGGFNGVEDRSNRTMQYLAQVQAGNMPLVTPGQATVTTPVPASAPVSGTSSAPVMTGSRQVSSNNPTLDELQKHTSLLSSLVNLLGKSPGSRRGYQMDPQAGANVAP
jgi:putative chitinase